MIRKKLLKVSVLCFGICIFGLLLLTLNSSNRVGMYVMDASNVDQVSNDYAFSGVLRNTAYPANEKVASKQLKNVDELSKITHYQKPTQSTNRKIPEVAFTESSKKISDTAEKMNGVRSNETKKQITDEEDKKNILIKKTAELTSNSELIKTKEKDRLAVSTFLRPKIKYLKKLNLTTCVEVNDCLNSKTVRWKMFIFVKTAAKFAKRRELIRTSYGSVKYVEGGLLHIIFVIGIATGSDQEMVEEEIRRYNDILQVDVLDNYLNVTRKTLASLQWASEHLDGNDFFSSADDDMSVNIGRLQQEVDKHIQETKKKTWPEFPILCSYESWDNPGPPIRSQKHKNYISVEAYKWPSWPKFCLGGMYTMSVNVARQLYEISRTTKPILNTDDVWITGVIRNRLGMPESMLIKVKPPIAAHLGGIENFDERKMKTRLDIMRKAAFDDIKSKSKCSC